jgi:hypothetical protein
MKVSNLDFIFISYDEPNAELNWADLKNKVPWAKRVHGVKGSDNAHKEAAKLAETDWFVTVDGDNIIYESFLSLDLNEFAGVSVYSWCGRNIINNLRYGNGGLKIWKKDFVLNMKTHEAAETEGAQIDFCWEAEYKNFPEVYSDTVINHTPYQAWRAGFREGVKMLVNKGIRPSKSQLHKEIHWQNIHRLRIWSSTGTHVTNGIFAVLGARMGSLMTYSEWDYINVRDFEELEKIYNEQVREYESNNKIIESMINRSTNTLRQELGLNFAFFNAEQSQHMIELYEEAISLGQTYYNKDPIWKNIS